MAVLKGKKRKKTATIVQKTDGKRYRFPMPDKAHARNALARLPQAKGLNAKERKKIKDRAYKMLYGTTDPEKIKKVKAKRSKK